MFGGYAFQGLFGYDTPVGSALLGSGNWVILWKGPLIDVGQGVQRAPVLAYFFYMAAFMDATATIPTGAMAERWKWNNFVVWGLFCGALYYPLFGSWTWGGGWLAKLGDSLQLGFGYVDFAGSGVVHAMGGVAALAGAIVLGPRIGKYSRNGKPQAIPGHNIPMALLGVIILMFGWFGFNGGVDARGHRHPVRSRHREHDDRGRVRHASSSMLYVMKRFGKPDPSMFGNGLLAGLVAITAPCAFVAPWAAAVIGIDRGDHRGRGGAVRRAARRRRPGGRDRGARMLTASGACSPSGCSRTGSTAPDWNGTDARPRREGRRRHRPLLRPRASAAANSRHRRSVRWSCAP